MTKIKVLSDSVGNGEFSVSLVKPHMLDDMIDIIYHSFVQSVNNTEQHAKVLERESRTQEEKMKFMMKHLRAGHRSPFRMAFVYFDLELPKVHMHQVLRHKNEHTSSSARYVSGETAFYIPKDSPFAKEQIEIAKIQQKIEASNVVTEESKLSSRIKDSVRVSRGRNFKQCSFVCFDIITLAYACALRLNPSQKTEEETKEIFKAMMDLVVAKVPLLENIFQACGVPNTSTEKCDKMK